MGRRIVLVVMLAAAMLRGTSAAPGPADQDLSVKALVAAASGYVARYTRDFAFLIADERYSQTRTGAGETQNRFLRSELFVTYLPADGEWVAVRDVIDVDGVPVPDREDLRTLLSRREISRGLVREVVAKNARYNIGRVTRNFNEPTLPLLLIEARRVRGVHFERKDVVREAGATLATLAFAERGRPTLIRGPNGPIPAKGEIVIEAGTGVVRRTTFELDKDGFRVTLTTVYGRDARLGLWLPTVFLERYDARRPPQELIVCQATYENYRRFDATARIKRIDR